MFAAFSTAKNLLTKFSRAPACFDLFSYNCYSNERVSAQRGPKPRGKNSPAYPLPQPPRQLLNRQKQIPWLNSDILPGVLKKR